MGVIGGADPVKKTIILVLIAVDLLPGATHRTGKGIFARPGGCEKSERQPCTQCGGAASDAEPA